MVDIYSTITRFFQDGGIFIYPIAFVLVIGLAIALERWVYLTRERHRNIKAFEDFLPLLRTTDLEKMQLYTREVAAPVTRIIGCGLDMMKVSKQRADIENSMSEGMLETMPRIEARTNYLAVMANVATLLGLLGTIIGLIGAFTAVANADPAEKSELLSLSISVAMNTTAFGLISAIPLLVLHSMLQNKTAKIVTSIEMAAVKFLNIMTIHRLIEAGMPRQESSGLIDKTATEAARKPSTPPPAPKPAPAPAQPQEAVAPAPQPQEAVAPAPQPIQQQVPVQPAQQAAVQQAAVQQQAIQQSAPAPAPAAPTPPVQEAVQAPAPTKPVVQAEAIPSNPSVPSQHYQQAVAQPAEPAPQAEALPEQQVQSQPEPAPQPLEQSQAEVEAQKVSRPAVFTAQDLTTVPESVKAAEALKVESPEEVEEPKKGAEPSA